MKSTQLLANHTIIFNHSFPHAEDLKIRRLFKFVNWLTEKVILRGKSEQ